MNFLIEIFWALILVGAPIAAFTLAIVWWSLERGHFKESKDFKALGRELKAMSKKRKKNGIDGQKMQHPVMNKWAKFGGGFYGIVAFFTYIVIEVKEIIVMIVDLGGFINFLKQLDIGLIISILVDAFTNFIAAMVWPAYWLKRIDTDQTWVWFVVAYAGYRAGLKLAQLMHQRRSSANRS